MVQRHNGYSGSQLSVINSQPVAINALEKLSISESLFTLFASLTYAYHYLMMLIK